MQDFDEPRRELLHLLERHRLMFLFFADARRFNPMSEPYRIERVDERDQAVFRSDEIDCDGEFLFVHRSRLDGYADAAMSKFGTGNGQEPLIPSGTKFVPVEGSHLPVWRVDQEGCEHLNESAATVIEYCQALRKLSDCELPQALLERAMRAVYDEARSRWISSNDVRWPYLSKLDEMIHAVRTSILDKGGARHLDITLGDRRASRIGDGQLLTTEFRGKGKPWEMFCILYHAGPGGMSRMDLYEPLWPNKSVTENNLDQHKRTANDVLQVIRVEIDADNCGVWRLVALNP